MKYILGDFEIDLSDLEDEHHQKALFEFKEVLVRNEFANKDDELKRVLHDE